MRCNLFKPINAGDTRMGTFLMFSQYTDDITKEQSLKSTYRVVPSKFVALNLNINNAFNTLPNESRFAPNGITSSGGRYGICGETDLDVNVILPQILQSYYENSMAFLRNQYEFEWEVEGRSYASELLWRTLQNWGLVTVKNDVGFEYFDEVKYVGDINIHSNHKVGGYSYDEIFCHIPASDDEYYYPVEFPELEAILIGEHETNRMLEEWTDATYPVDPNDAHNYLANRAISWHDTGYDYYHIGGRLPRLQFDDTTLEMPVPRHEPDEVNVEYNFNAVIIFYDVLYSEPGEDPRYLHRFRPMGIYLSGPMAWDSQHTKVEDLENHFTKYISNNDAYGQGASFGLRIMTRYTPTPNMSTYTMEVDASGNDYETIIQAMGSIADAIVDISRSYKDQHEMFQAYKDHLAMFRNRRVNVPYPREVNGRMYWFINGRNTGQPCQYDGQVPTEKCNVYIAPCENGSISVTYKGEQITESEFQVNMHDVISIEAVPDEGYSFTSWNDGNTEPSRELSITYDTHISATFSQTIEQHIVSVVTPENGTVDVYVDGQYIDESTFTVDDGASITMEATPDTGYIFDSWSDGNTEQTRTITITSDYTIEAIFRASVVEVNVELEYDNNIGSVEIS